jgi:hypothetical protein
LFFFWPKYYSPASPAPYMFWLTVLVCALPFELRNQLMVWSFFFLKSRGGYREDKRSRRKTPAWLEDLLHLTIRKKEGNHHGTIV